MNGNIIILTLITGCCAGFVNGLLGTGGGIVLLFAMKHLKSDIDTKSAFAITLFVTLVYSMLSALLYKVNGKLDTGLNPTYIIPAITGGIVGAMLLNKLDTKVLKKIFCVILIISGINMIFF